MEKQCPHCQRKNCQLITAHTYREKDNGEVVEIVFYDLNEEASVTYNFCRDCEHRWWSPLLPSEPWGDRQS